MLIVKLAWDTAMVEILQTSGVLVSPFLGLVWALVAFLVVSRNCEVTFMALVNLLLLSGVYVATSSVAYLIGNTTIARFLGAEE